MSQILGVRIDDLKIEQVLARVDVAKKIWIATVNPEFVMMANRDKKFFELLKKTDLNVIDGIGLVWAKLVVSRKSKVERLSEGFRVGVEILRGQHRGDLVPGVELVDKMCQQAAENGKSVYFLGGWGDRSKKTAEYFEAKYPKLKVAGFKDEDFDFDTKADYLFVAYGMKKQEEWIEKNYDKLKVKVVMGVGRSFDYYSGELKRAPEWLRRMGFEWLYSLIKEPKRWKRQLQLPLFIIKILQET